MKTKSKLLILALITFYSYNCFCQDYSIYNGQVLADGLDMGVDTDKKERGWVSDMNGYMKMVYPSNQAWGAVFITVGAPRTSPRPFRNFSGYSTLSVEIRGENGGEHIEIGIKDNTDPDNGQETKIPINLTQKWQEYEFSLADFRTAELTHLYVVIEFIFGGPKGKTAYFRNIQYKR